MEIWSRAGGASASGRSRAAVVLLGLLHRLVGIGRTGLPVGGERVVAGAAEGVEHDRVVVDDDADGASIGEGLEQFELENGGRSAIALRPHHHASTPEPVLVEPAHGVVMKVVRATSQEHDLVIGGERVHDSHTLGVHGVVPSGGEERSPVLGTAFEVAKAVAHVGHDAVEVDDGQWTFVVGRAHAALSSGVDSAAWCGVSGLGEFGDDVLEAVVGDLHAALHS